MSARLDPGFFRAIFERLPAAVLIADDRAQYVEANEAACALLGRPRDEIVGRHLSDLVSPQRNEEATVQWQAFLRDGEQTGLFTVRRPDGTTIDVHFKARANFVPGYHCSFLTTEAGTTYPDVLLCTWSKRVLHDSRWIPIEQYLTEVHGLVVRHTVSPGALEAPRAR